MSAISFAIRDLSRRKFQAFLAITGLAACIASTVFLLLLGRSFGFQIHLILSGQDFGFSFLLSRFIAFVIILNLVIGGLITFFLFSLSMSERTKDIGIMKAFGCLTTSVFAIFTTELSIVVFIGCILGIITGIMTYLGICAVIPSLVVHVDLTSTLVLFFGFALFSHFLGARSIGAAIQMRPADALSPSFLFSSTTEFSGKSLSRFGLTIRVAFRSLMRRALPTRNIYLCLTIILTLVTIAVGGGLIASDTTGNYLERAIGRDVILVAHKNIIDNYAALLTRFHEQTTLQTIDYLSLQYDMPESLIYQLVEISGASKSEKRLLYETRAYEGYGVIINPDDPGGYQYVGEGRSCQTFIIGIEPSQAIANWFIEGDPLTDNTSDGALIGSNLATQIFTSPFNQEIIISEENYRITGICIDPFNSGNVTYLHLNSVQAHCPIACNLLFLKIASKNQSQVLDQLNNYLIDTDFQLLDLNPILHANMGFLQDIWSLIMWLPLLSLVGAGICLYTFLTFAISVQQREFGIMRAVGAKRITVAKIVITQTLAILLASTLSGTSIGSILNLFFLIPEPIITANSVAFYSVLLLSAVLILLLLSLYPIWKITRRTIIKAKLHSN
ncbi:MAG: FtsX-like permease family protein [Candidatus Bathyarchaeota archaeon]|nr:MAG: FtsX-like permease family protein [Candidatus Bathyarchaeota archaeon]